MNWTLHEFILESDVSLIEEPVSPFARGRIYTRRASRVVEQSDSEESVYELEEIEVKGSAMGQQEDDPSDGPQGSCSCRKRM